MCKIFHRLKKKAFQLLLPELKNKFKFPFIETWNEKHTNPL